MRVDVGLCRIDGSQPPAADAAAAAQGWDESEISFEFNQISSKFLIGIEYRIEYEYSVAQNSIRILIGVEVSNLEAASSRGYGHKAEPESSASWPCTRRSFCLPFDITFCLFSGAKPLLTYLMYIYTHKVTK